MRLIATACNKLICGHNLKHSVNLYRVLRVRHARRAERDAPLARCCPQKVGSSGPNPNEARGMLTYIKAKLLAGLSAGACQDGRKRLAKEFHGLDAGIVARRSDGRGQGRAEEEKRMRWMGEGGKGGRRMRKRTK